MTRLLHCLESHHAEACLYEVSCQVKASLSACPDQILSAKAPLPSGGEAAGSRVS